MTQNLKKLAIEYGLSESEYDKVLDILGRDPNQLELGIFSVMWSEHCSYKSSRLHLKKLPTEGPQVVQGPGENAGVVDIGDGWGIAFKMESHNHPSFIEPFQGAATGVGGILRDVFTMGARPIANLNSLRFGAADHPKTAYLLNGVVEGIAAYGNCVGVPTVGGEVFFDPSYNGNILVNAMTVGLVKQDRIFKGLAQGVGNPVLYVGSKTGRDGIHGATMASDEFDEASEEKRPTVQVGDPFTEKLLLEACLEVMSHDYLVGIQDMGAAGLTSSSFEMASRAGSGIEMDLSKIPTRETGMTPYEMMLSESQERMLMVAKQGCEDKVRAIVEKWDLDAVVVGHVTADGMMRLKFEGEVVGELPIAPLVEAAPVYDRPAAEPKNLKERQHLDLTQLDFSQDWNDTLLKMMASPNLCNRRWVYRQYDHMVMTNTVVEPGGDGAVLRLKGLKQGVAVTADCNSRYCYLDPRLGAAHAVAEAARNLACVGAQPLAITDCLNFGNPEKPEIMWEFQQAIAGMGEACLALDTPVVSGNVSFYNDTQGKSVFPTPTVGMVGKIKDVTKAGRAHFQQEGDLIYLIGELSGSLGASEYLNVMHGQVKGRPPELDLAKEKSLNQFLVQAWEQGLLQSAHDVSDGGLAVALAECCLAPEGKNFGLKWVTEEKVSVGAGSKPAQKKVEKVVTEQEIAELLFGENSAKVIISINSENIEKLKVLCDSFSLNMRPIGQVGSGHFQVGSWIDLDINEIREVWEAGLERISRGGF